MQWASRTKHFLRRSLDRRKTDEELQEEVQAYFDTMVERRMERGLSREEALRLTRLEYGDPLGVREAVGEARAGAWLEALYLDSRYAWRALRKNPGFAVAATLSLGLGLGANIAVFTLVNRVMLQSLVVEAPEQLFFIDNSGGKSGGSSGPPYPCFEILRDHNRHFSGMAAFNENRFRVTIDGVEEKMTGQYASGHFFEVLGIRPVLGRLLTDASADEAVISYRLWERRFGRRAEVVGKEIRVGTDWVKIAGVTPPGFDGLTPGLPVDVTVSMTLAKTNLRSKTSWWFSVVGRLRTDAPVEAARAELDSLFHAYMDEVGMKGDRYFSGITLVPAAKGLEGLRRAFSRPLLIVMAIAGLVLLIGCANAANLLLARASARREEIALRLAIGASRARLLRQLFTEGLLLTALAACVAVVLAKWGVTALVALLAGVRGRIILEPEFDWRVVLFTVAAGVLTSLLFSFAPALHAIRAAAAKPGVDSRGSASAFPLKAGRALVIVQITLSVVLLCGAALFLRSLRNLSGLDAGFQRAGVVSVQAESVRPGTGSKQGKEAAEEHARIGRMWLEAIAPLEGHAMTRAVSASSLSPMSGRDRGILMEVSGVVSQSGQDRGIHINQASAGYFEVFGVSLLAGRVFTVRDGANPLKVAVLNDAAARRFFADANPLGRLVNFPGQRVTGPYEIVGVVRDARYESLRKAPEPMVYVPLEQAVDPLGTVILSIRGRGDLSGQVAALRESVRKTVPGGLTSSAATLEQLVDEALLQERMLSILANVFGGLALLLTAIGIYGILSFTVLRRRREIGIRMAMGAERASLVWLMLRSTLAMGGAGLALGTPLVLAGKTYIESELFGMQGSGAGVIAAALVVLAAVAIGAGVLPAWRASRVDAVISLRHE